MALTFSTKLAQNIQIGDVVLFEQHFSTVIWVQDYDGEYVYVVSHPYQGTNGYGPFLDNEHVPVYVTE